MALYFISNKKISTSLKKQQPNKKEWQFLTWIKHFSLTRKLFSAYSITFLLVVCGITFGFEQGRQLEQQAIAVQAEAHEDIETITKFQASLLDFFFLKQKFIDAPIPTQENFLQMRDSHIKLRRQWYLFLTSEELIAGADGDDNLDAAVTEAEAQLAQALIEEHADNFDRYLTVWESLVIPSGDLVPLSELQQKMTAVEQSYFIADVGDFLDKVNLLYDATKEEQNEADDVVKTAARRQIQIMLLSVCVSGVMGLALIYYISNVLMRPLRSMTTATQEAVNTENFDLNIAVNSKDEVGLLANTFNAYSNFVKNLLWESEAANKKLERTLADLKNAQSRIIQSEKMSSLGQLVAGVAHEINNPISFVHGNIFHLETHIQDLLKIPELYQRYYAELPVEIATFFDEIDLDFVQEDLPRIISSMRLGTERITDIVLALRNFSRLDNASLTKTNIHADLENTLMIVRHRLVAHQERPKITLKKNYGELPEVDCYPGLLNQVFMNLLVNALDTLDEKLLQQTPVERWEDPPTIEISTALIRDNQWIRVAIADNCLGIPEKLRRKIFEPFFTTKPIGQGTGMGLSISYQLITEKHLGRFDCISTHGKGTTMIIEIPLGLTSDNHH